MNLSLYCFETPSLPCVVPISWIPAFLIRFFCIWNPQLAKKAPRISAERFSVAQRMR
jgi:hypothetical protein